jgi:acetyltransferase-like isoleucine patch superfamily enzyme
VENRKRGAMNFKNIGRNVRISPMVRIYGEENIEIGNNVRIDDFCILSAVGGSLKIGDHIHIACYTSLFAGGGIILEDFSQISSRSSLYSKNDNYKGHALAGPCIYDKYKLVDSRPILMKRHSLLGVNSVILPGVVLHEGAVVGAFSLVKKECLPWCVYAGVPVKQIGERGSDIMIDYEKKFLEEYHE